MKEKFRVWMKNSTKKRNGEKYKYPTIEHYITGIETIKREYNINFWEIETDEILQKKDDLLQNSDFIKKDIRGGKMYSCALKKYIEFIFDINVEPIKKQMILVEEDTDIDYDLKDKYAEVLCDIRNPQFQRHFRKQLIKEFNCKCALCGINDERMLIASHIIPYSECIDKSDMYDSHNGLLLCADHDCLFDKHLISFDSNGKIIISHTIRNELYDFLKIDSKMSLEKRCLSDDRKKCLSSHLESFVKKQKKI